jgi:cytochrome b involved in lipid metabolism
MKGRHITAGDMEAHIKDGGGWVVIHGEVYDVQSLATLVPCGVDKLMENVGRDATEAFEAAGHSDVAREKMKHCIVGEFREVSAAAGVGGAWDLYGVLHVTCSFGLFLSDPAHMRIVAGEVITLGTVFFDS